MQVIKFKSATINGADESTLNWKAATPKDELMVEVFTSEKLFEDLAIYWKKLQKRADAKICMSYEWAFTWWKHFGRNKQRSLFIVTVWDGTKLVGVAPFCKGYSAWGSVVIETRLQIIGSGGSPNEQLGYLDEHGVSGFLDFIVDPMYISQVADLMAEDVMTLGFLGVDVVKLHQVGDDSFIMKSLVPRLRKQHANIKIDDSAVCPYIDLSEPGLKEFTENQNLNTRRMQQTIPAEESEQGHKIADVSGSMEEVEKAAEEIIKLHQNRSNRLGSPGVFCDRRFIAFFKDTLIYAYKNDWLWLKQVKSSEGISAFRMALRYNNRYYDYISVFDDEDVADKHRLVNGLLAKLIEDGIAEDINRIELLRSEEEEHNIGLTSDSVTNWKVQIPLGKKKVNIPWLLNRIGAWLFKYGMREKRILELQRQESGRIKMFWGYLRFRWQKFELF